MLLWNADQSYQDLKRGSSGAVGKTSGVCAWLPSDCLCMLGRVDSIFLFCACKVLGTVRFVFAMAKYILVVCI